MQYNPTMGKLRSRILSGLVGAILVGLTFILAISLPIYETIEPIPDVEIPLTVIANTILFPGALGVLIGAGIGAFLPTVFTNTPSDKKDTQPPTQ